MQTTFPILELIGLTALQVVRKKLDEFRENDQIGMIRFDSFDSEVLAACFNVIAAKQANEGGVLNEIDLRLTKSLVKESDVQYPAILTDLTPAAIRNENNIKTLTLFANSNEDITRDTLKEVGKITETDLLADTDAWIVALTETRTQLSIQELKDQLRAMFSGLNQVMIRSLRVSTEFLMAVADEVVAGTPITESVNDNLKLLGYPSHINAMPKDNRACSVDEWVKTFEQVKKIPSEYFKDNVRPYSISLSDLKERLEQLRQEAVPVEALEIFQSLATNDGVHYWSELINLDWEEDFLRNFVQKEKISRKPKGIPEATLDCIGKTDFLKLESLISGSNVKVKEFLESLKNVKKLDDVQVEEGRRFYSDFGSLISQADPALDKRWDKLLFSDTLEGVDFVDCVLQAAKHLNERVDVSKINHPVLLLRCRTTGKKLNSDINRDLLSYFALMYRGLETQCNQFLQIRFKSFSLKSTNDLNPLFHFAECQAYLRSKLPTKGKKKKDKSTSISKDNLKLEFDAFLVEDSQVETELSGEKSVRITWYLNKASMALSLAKDWQELALGKHRESDAYSVVFAKNFKQTNTKGLISEITLEDSSSFGLTVPNFIYRNRNNLTNLKSYFETLLDSDVSGIDVQAIREAFATFDTAYLNALADVNRIGLGAPSIPVMYKAYGELLKLVSNNAERSQHFRQYSLSYLLSIGVFSFIDLTSAYAVVTPWQPLRLYELHRQFVRKVGLIQLYVTGNTAGIKNSTELIGQIIEHDKLLEPSFVVVPQDGGIEETKKHCAEILSPIEESSGYSLYSRVVGPDCRDNGTSAAAAKEFADIATSNYLSLVPHASNCLKTILPDVVSKQFPTQVIHEMIENLADYQKLSVVVGGLNADQYKAENEERLFQGLTIETSRSQSLEEAAIASLSMRSGVQVAVSRVKDDFYSSSPLVKDGICPFDIAFVDRFFTYSAKGAWVELPRRDCDSNPYNLNSSIQLRSRRLVQLENEFTSTTLLCNDAVSPVGHSFINAASWLLRNTSADKGDTFEYPCLQVDCNETNIAKNIQSLHKLAHWVVTINDFIDRRQLINNKIKIVRYKNNSKTGKTSIISSEMSTDVLSKRIEDRIATLYNGSLRNEAAELADSVLEASYRISGYVALRSARGDKYANEIIGLVLSNWIIQNSLVQQAKNNGEDVLAAVSYLVDDYASIFKNRSRLADLLCLVLAEKEGKCILHIGVTEAKFCAESILHEQQKKSADQLSATYEVLSGALRDSDKARADRPIWLARLADMITSLSKSDLKNLSLSSKQLIEFADAVKKGCFKFTLSGASHVFAYDHDKSLCIDNLACSDNSSALTQIVFGAEDTVNALKAFHGAMPSQGISEVLANNMLPKVPLVQPWVWSNNIELTMLKSGINAETSSDADVEGQTGKNLPEPSPNQFVEEPTVNSKVNVEPYVSVTAEPQGLEQQPMDGSNKTESRAQVQVSTDNRTFAPYFEQYVQSRASQSEYSPERIAWAKKATDDLRMTLVANGMHAKVLNHSLTPNGCLVCFEGSADLLSKNVLALKEMLLTTRAINLVFVLAQPGSLLVLFNDGSDDRETVPMWNIWANRKVERRFSGSNLSIAIGLKETDGKLLCLNPMQQPHTLIAGRTGSGKTVLMQTMLLDMAATNPSDLLKFYIIDPKGGNDYLSLLRLPHLAAPLINQPNEAIELFKQLVEEMNRRMTAFREVQAGKLDRYNSKVQPKDRLPYIFVIHDELPQWMVNKDYRQEVEELMTQLATMSRATGIYLIVLAQRPDKDVMPMQVRSNLGNRLVLQVDAATAEIALGAKGAENLLGRGQLVAGLDGKYYYAQAPYLDESLGELDDAVDAIIEGDKEWCSS